jgi:hypothetical protein
MTFISAQAAGLLFKAWPPDFLSTRLEASRRPGLA